MRSRIAFVIAATALVTSAGAPAQAAQDHAAHHPASVASGPAGKAAKPKAPAPTAMQMDAQMQAMHEMHDKMMAARSPEERQALMADHMKAMQDGMSMMGRMQGGSMAGGMSGSQHDMMQRRMDMMQMTMQLMMDREGAAASAAK